MTLKDLLKYRFNGAGTLLVALLVGLSVSAFITLGFFSAVFCSVSLAAVAMLGKKSDIWKEGE